MTRARNQLICPDVTPPYRHTIFRSVRRAFLRGEDSLTGKDYEHRKRWVTERLRELTDTFPIDVRAYAVMSNHYQKPTVTQLGVLINGGGSGNRCQEI